MNVKFAESCQRPWLRVETLRELKSGEPVWDFVTKWEI
jgi:hypothetical protein